MKKFALGVFTGWLITQVCVLLVALADEDLGDAIENSFDKAFNRLNTYKK